MSGAAAGPAVDCARPSLNALMAGTGQLDRPSPRAVRAARRRRAGRRRGPGPRRAVPGAAGRRGHVRCRRRSATTPTSTRPIHHATNVGRMFRPDNPLLPNYKYVPIGYHGRASSIVAERHPGAATVGTDEAGRRRTRRCSARAARLDYELEVGVFVGPGNASESPVPIDAHRRSPVRPVPRERLVGARHPDLGVPAARVRSWPRTSPRRVSPWVVTMEALAPFRRAGPRGPRAIRRRCRTSRATRTAGAAAFDVTLEVFAVEREDARRRITGPCVVSASNSADMYWTLAQMVAHHTSNGCNLRPGDLLASGTVSGPSKDARGCLLELTWRGTEPLTLPTGEERALSSRTATRWCCAARAAGRRRHASGSASAAESSFPPTANRRPVSLSPIPCPLSPVPYPLAPLAPRLSPLAYPLSPVPYFSSYFRPAFS